jgi:hypothetical protein
VIQVKGLYVSSDDDDDINRLMMIHQPINIPTAGAQAFLMDYT